MLSNVKWGLVASLHVVATGFEAIKYESRLFSSLSLAAY